MSEVRSLQLEPSAWTQLQRDVRAGATDGVAGVLSDHLLAPVKAAFVAASGSHGVRTRLTMRGGQVVLVSQRMGLVDGAVRVEAGAQLTFSGPDGLWAAVARMAPETDLLRAPAGAVGEAEDRPLDLSPDAAMGVLAGESCNLQARVEAWQGGAELVRAWDRQWSVQDDRLIDVRIDEGDLALVERPAGSVAKELSRALAEAVRVTGAGR